VCVRDLVETACRCRREAVEVPAQSSSASGIVTATSPRSAVATLSRLRQILDEKGVQLFAVIDHSGAAAEVGLTMPDTKLVVFGSPAAGTPVMTAAPLTALDLPLKILIWEDGTGTVSVSYNSPAYVAERHHLSDELRARLEPIVAICNALVADT
jgi:uncharacterized protein (DUF302 family)